MSTSPRSDASPAREYVPLADVCHPCLHMQVQYGSRYLGGLDSTGDPDLSGSDVGDGRVLRYTPEGPGGNYHAMTLHRDDAVEFVRRVALYRASRRSISQQDAEQMIAAAKDVFGDD